MGKWAIAASVCSRLKNIIYFFVKKLHSFEKIMISSGDDTVVFEGSTA